VCDIFHLGGLLQLKEKNFTKLCSTKSTLTVNGSFPGPTIRVHKGDTAFVTVHNQGRYGVTIHWLIPLLCLSFYIILLPPSVHVCAQPHALVIG